MESGPVATLAGKRVVGFVLRPSQELTLSSTFGVAFSGSPYSAVPAVRVVSIFRTGILRLLRATRWFLLTVGPGRFRSLNALRCH